MADLEEAQAAGPSTLVLPSAPGCHQEDERRDKQGIDDVLIDVLNTPQRHAEVKGIARRLASLSLPESDLIAQGSPDSVLPSYNALPLKALLESSERSQKSLNSSHTRDTAEFQTLQHQHEQLLAFNNALVEENNQCLANHAELVSQLMLANQRAYQAERASTTAGANAAQLQGEVLRLSNQMDTHREDVQTQSSLAESLQEQLQAAHQHMTQQQRRNLAKMEKQGWEAADWKASALETTQKLAAANAQIAQQSRVIVAQEQAHARDVAKLNAQLMHYSAVAGIKSFSPSDLADDGDDED